MNKNFYTAIFTAIFIVSASFCLEAKDKAKELDMRIIKENKVSKCTEFLIEPKSAKKQKRAISEYDASGFKKKMAEYKPGGALDKRFEYICDTAGNELKSHEYSGDGILKSSKESAYNVTGDILAESTSNKAGKIIQKRSYKYDANADISEQETTGPNGGIIGKTTYKYDGKHNKIEQTAYGKNNELTGRWVYKYGANDLLSETVIYSKDNKLSGKWVYKYNEKKLISEMTGYNSSNAVYFSKKYEYEFFTAVAASAPKTPNVVKNPTAEQNEPQVTMNPGEEPVSSEFTTSKFILAAEHGSAEDMARMLDEGKLNVNGKDGDGWTPLISASVFGNADAVKFLLDHGADPDIRDNKGMTAFDHARKRGRNNVIGVIKKQSGEQK
ncbi:MAG TPA: ankyrin repeat domain-containing protein [Candidatus Wallbacteria bacterium]|nr:ankyrin repeat domain-containing protein [Candidatus Wallbacteria bacterium]